MKNNYKVDAKTPTINSDGDGTVGLFLRLLRYDRLVRLAGRRFQLLRWQQVIGWR